MADQQPAILVYAGKFLCGVFDPEHAGDQEGLEGPVRPGAYTTAINVHNPNPRRPALFRKKAVLLFKGSKPVLQEEFERPVGAGEPVNAELPPDGALEIDCPDIRRRLLQGPDAPTFIKGMVVIETPPDSPLDVVAVYTAEALEGNRPFGLAIEVERILPTAVQL